MTKHRRTLAVSVLMIAGFASGFVSGCVNPRRVSGVTFQRELQMAETMFSAEYIGEADGKVYLLRKSMPLIDTGSGWKEEIHYADIRELPADFLTKIRNEATTKNTHSTVPK